MESGFPARVLFDGDYTEAFVLAALDGGLVALSDAGREYEREHGRRAVRRFFNRHRAGRYRARSLELAALFGSVDLFDVPALGLLDFARVKAEGLVHAVHGRGFVPPGAAWDSKFLEVRLRASWRFLQARTRWSLRTLTADGGSARPAEVDGMLKTGFDLLKTLGGHDAGGLSWLIYYLSTAPNFDPDDPNDGMVQALHQIAAALGRDFGLSMFDAGHVLREFLATAATIAALQATSSAYKVPYASAAVPERRAISVRGRVISPPSEVLDAHALCLMNLTDLLGYTPVVESLRDVLRLRQDGRMELYRRNLSRWTAALREDGEQAALLVKRDIEAQKSALARLSTWRKIDRFLLWFALPAACIPKVPLLYAASKIFQTLNLRAAEREQWVGLWR